MADEVEVPDYKERIAQLIDKTVFELFKKTSQYEELKQQVFASANTKETDIDTFIKTATQFGVSEEAAFTCVMLFIMSKLQSKQ